MSPSRSDRTNHLAVDCSEFPLVDTLPRVHSPAHSPMGRRPNSGGFLDLSQGQPQLNKLLVEACRSSNSKEAEALLQSKADPNCRDQFRNSPLHIVAGTGRADIARLLLYRGADKDAKDKKGKNPLMTAIREGHADVVRILELQLDQLREDDQKELESMKGMAGVLRQELTAANKRIRDLEEQLDVVGRENAHNRQLQSRMEEAVQELRASHSRIAELEMELAKLNADFASACAEARDAEALRAELRSLRDAGDETQAQLQRQNTDTAGEVARARQESQALSEQMMELREELRVMQKKLEEAELQCGREGRALNSTKDELLRAKMEIETSERSFQAKAAELEFLKKELKKANAGNEETGRKLRVAEAQLSKEQGSRERQVQDLKDQILQLQEQKRETDTQLEKALMRRRI